MNSIIGSGGKSGGGGGGISESPDTLSSVAFARFVDLIGEGEIGGLVNGDYSIYLDGVPLRNLEGTPNFRPFQSQRTVGTQAQLPIPGFSGTTSEVAVGIKLTFVTGRITRPVSDADADSVRVTVAVQGLSKTSNEGKIGPSTVEYTVSVRVSGGTWVPTTFTLTGKTGARYQRSHEVSLSNLGSGPYEVAVTRTTADSTSSLLTDSLYWDSYATINYEPFSYPNSALIALEVDGRYFSSVPTRAYHVRGLIVKVPSNYNPVTRVYTGVWDGSFKPAYTNNPAWCFYDIVTNKRYGLGKRISESQISKWVMYSIAKYCDQPVPTGLTTNVFSQTSKSSFSPNGTITSGIPLRDQTFEPRFTLNVVINTKMDAYKLLNNLSSVFRGMSYWASGMVTLTQDRPTKTGMIWTNANVIDGMFTYEGSARADRHTTATVGWNDPAEDFRQRYEYVEDRAGILRYGVRPIEAMAYGCTSRSQARRMGLWLLYTERFEKDAIKFRTGLDSAQVMPGDVGKIMDNNRTGARWGGRVLSALTTAVALDAPLTLDAGTYTLSTMAIDGTVVDRAVNVLTAGTFTALSVAIAYTTPPAPMAIWTLASTTVVPMLGRVISVHQVSSSEFDIVCLEHNPAKYAAIETGAAFQDNNYSFLTYDKVNQVTNLIATENSFKTSISSVTQTNVEVSWDSMADPLIRGYRLKSVAAGGSVINWPEQSEPFKSLFGISPDIYTFTVSAVNALAVVGPVSTFTLLVTGVDSLPPSNVVGLTCEILTDGGMRFSWAQNTEIDYLETELHLEGVWNSTTKPLFVGRASSHTVSSFPAGAFVVLAKHRDTSLNLSLVAAAQSGVMPVIDVQNSLIVVGGRNLAKASNKFTSTEFNYNRQINPISGIDDGLGGLSATSVQLGTVSWDMYRAVLNLGVGSTCIVSVWVNLGTANNFCLTLNNSLDWNSNGPESRVVITGNGWQRAVARITTSTGKVNCHFGAHSVTNFTQQLAGTVMVRNMQVEVGNVATQWNPAPEDIDAGIAYAGTTSSWSGTYGSGKPADNASSDIVLINGAGTTISGNSVAKTGGTDGVWDAGFYSKDGYTGGAFVSFSPAQTDKYLMVGLNRDPALDNSYSSIDYAWYVQSGATLAIYESDARRDYSFPYAAGDVLSVTYDGVNIRYLQNGIERRTVLALGLPAMYVDSSFYGTGGKVTNVRFGPLSSNVWSDTGGAGKPADYATRNLVSYQETPPVNSVNGDLWFSTTAASWEVYTGGTWQVVSDVTASKVAAGIAGQGALATLNNVSTTNIATDAVSQTVVYSDAAGVTYRSSASA